MLQEHFFLTQPLIYFGSLSPEDSIDQELPEILFSVDKILLDQKHVGLFMSLEELPLTIQGE